MGRNIHLLLLFIIFVLFFSFLNVSFAGTVDSATLSPSSVTLKAGEVQTLIFSATNDKTFDIKTFHAEFVYTKGLKIANIDTTPPAAKATVNASKSIITFEWSNFAQGDTLTAAFDVSGDTARTFSITPVKITYSENRKTVYNGSCNSVEIVVLDRTAGTVSGTVSDASTGAPIGNVAVTIVDSQETTFTTTTAESGDYTVFDVAPGNFTAGFRAKGYLEQTATGLSGGQSLILNVLLTPENAVYETIRPADAFNPGGWINPSSGFDTDVNTYAVKNNVSTTPSISFGGSSSNESINAWQNKSQYWNSAWLYVTFETIPGGSADDLVELQVTDRLGNLKHTLLPTTTWTAKKGFAQKLQMSDWGDGFNSIGDLRLRVNGYRKRGADNGEARVYDLRINGDPSPYLKNYSRGAYTLLPSGDGDLTTDYSPADIGKVAVDDGDRVVQIASYLTDKYPVHLFKEKAANRNLRIRWSGQIGNPYEEAFAVSFSLDSSRNLDQMSFHIYRAGNPDGSVRVRLKSEPGGSVLAESDTYAESFIPALGGWVPFLFGNPAYLSAGKTYYAEIWRDRFDVANYLELDHWICPDRSGFVRYDGNWFETETVNFAVDAYNTISKCQDSIFSRHIYGLDWKPIYLDVYNRITASWDRLDTRIYDGSTSDMELSGIVSSDNYFDADGWVAAKVTTEAMGNSSYPWYMLATDSIQFSEQGEIAVSPLLLDFGTVTTHGSAAQNILISNIGTGELPLGMITPPSAPFVITSDGCSGVTLSASASCSLAVAFSPTAEGAFTGTVSIPYNDNTRNVSVSLQGDGIPQLVMLTGAVADSTTGMPLPGVQVTVSDAAGSRAVTTDFSGIYSLANVSGPGFVVVFKKTGYVDQTISGTLPAGPTMTLNVQLQRAPALTVVIVAPQDEATVTASPVAVTGTVTNEASVAVNGVSANVAGGLFSASVPLSEGPNTVTASATDQYGQTASKSIQVTLMTKGNITGTIMDSASGLPLSEATVSVTDSLNITRTASTDMNGAYAIAGVASGAFTGSVSKAYYNTYAFSGMMSPGQTIIIDAALSPIPPAIGNIASGNITYNSAVITWTTDQPSDSRIEYGTSASYGTSVTDATLTTNHSITLTNLSSGTSCHFRVESKNSYGYSSSSDDFTFTTLSPITLIITSPSAEQTLAQSDVMVKGTITNSTGNETGVTVNGIVATVYGNQFIVNHVPLTEGQNTITVTATDTSGNSLSKSVSVNAVTTGNYIRITSNIDSGISPLQVTLRIDGSFNIASSDISVTGPGTVEFLPGTLVDEYEVIMTTEGIYYFTASVTGPDNIVYQDTIAVTVVNRTQLDNLLRVKWTTMMNSLSLKDTTAALLHISAVTKPMYTQMLNEIIDQLPAITATQRELNFLYATDNIAKFELVTFENSKLYSYEVTFGKDEHGLWKVVQY